jgi:hypothetical protein
MVQRVRLGEVVYVWWLPTPVRHYGLVISEGHALSETIIRTVGPGNPGPVNQRLCEFSNGKRVFIAPFWANSPGRKSCGELWTSRNLTTTSSQKL